jgi:quercetin dioxygenase-like cupin family protein
MNPLTQFKKISILPFLIALALVAGATLTVVPALATAGSGVTTEFIVGSATGGATFDELDISVKTAIDPNGHGGPYWKARIDTKGASDLYVVRNTFAAGGHTGWHTHPGPSLITVTVGTITAYEGDDPTCTPHVYLQGSTFIDPGGGHVHLLRNESGSLAVTVAVQLVPAGAPRRIDVTPAPGNCPF